MPTSGMFSEEAPIEGVALAIGATVGVEVGLSDPVETALIGAGETVGAGDVVGIGDVVRLKLPVAACELVDGSDAGSTPPLCEVLLQRPWHSD
jgi:hypothetical protein